MKIALIGLGMVGALLYFEHWNRKRKAACAGGSSCSCSGGNWSGSNSPAYRNTAATNDVSVPGVPEEEDQPMKVCPPTRDAEGCH